MMPPFYYLGRGFVRLVLPLLARWQIEGRENVPEKGPLIVVANHLHNFDPPILSASLPRPVVFMAKEELFGSWWSWAVRAYGAFPVKRNGAHRQALRQARQVLEQGLVLGMFPEGTRSPHAQLQPGKDGATLIAYHSGAPILPVAISGTEKLKGMSCLISRQEVRVSIGQPFALPRPSGRLTKSALASLTTDIMMHIAELLPPAYRGVYAKDLAEAAIPGGLHGD